MPFGICLNSAECYRPINTEKSGPASSKCNASLPNCDNAAMINQLLDAAQEIQDFCTRQRWSFRFIGGIAVLHWVEPRLTRDADISIFISIADEANYVDVLLHDFAPRLEDSRVFALQNRILLLRATNGIPLDVSLGALPF